MKYRPEIDGLRAVAVLPVMLFHAGFNAFSGGFVGVDVFFVISGYLITGILLAELRAGDFSVAKFYERRVRRILPALFFVLIFSFAFALMWLLPEDLKSFSKSLVATPLFLSNVFFYRSTGYFDTASAFKPLIHTWTLSLEEQYYIIFPLFLWVLWRIREYALIVVIGVLLFSLGYAEYQVEHNRVAAFYLLPARVWEFLVGAIVAFVPLRGGFRCNLFDIGALSGLVLILCPMFFLDEGGVFPVCRLRCLSWEVLW